MLFKILCAFAIVAIISAVENAENAVGSRQVRSPSGADWQSSGFDSGAAFSARSAPGGYGALGRSSGWGGSFGATSGRFGGSGGWQASGRSLDFNSGWNGLNSRSSNEYSSGW